MQRGAVLLGVVAFLALWPQAGAEPYNLNDPDVRAMINDGRKLMDTCAKANHYIADRWSTYRIEYLEDKGLYHRMLRELVPCLNNFLRTRQEAP
uniref:Conotoxin F_Vc1 n=1 Tax=Conus victoriae TaxID=319920 RepID=FX1_CONVC|nr:RecName: Full=Conotoxin F_Vc1; Flags: Precursor [Conus victoriae]